MWGKEEKVIKKKKRVNFFLSFEFSGEEPLVLAGATEVS